MRAECLRFQIAAVRIPLQVDRRGDAFLAGEQIGKRQNGAFLAVTHCIGGQFKLVVSNQFERHFIDCHLAEMAASVFRVKRLDRHVCGIQHVQQVFLADSGGKEQIVQQRQIEPVQAA